MNPMVCPTPPTKNKELILPLYKFLVRPHLEHAVKFWSQHVRRDIDKIEKIQRRATKMIPEIRNHSCHRRIWDLDLISLVQRRLRGQLIEVFKYLNELTTASAWGLFDYDLNDRTRNNGAKLIIEHFNTSVAQHFYPIKMTSNRECPTKWSCKQQDSELFQEKLEQTLGRKSPKYPCELVAIIDVVHTSRVQKQSYASVLLGMDPTVCPTSTTTTTPTTTTATTH